MLATLGVVPIIRCPKGGAAEHVAAQLDAMLREALKAPRGGPFSSDGAGTGAGLAASLQRPLLCLFDRNFELSVVLQHSWTYKPLVGGLGSPDWLAGRQRRVHEGGGGHARGLPCSAMPCVPPVRLPFPPSPSPSRTSTQVHDVLGMRLNRITLTEAPAPGQPPAAPGAKKAYEASAATCWAAPCVW